mgnify:FL=1
MNCKLIADIYNSKARLKLWIGLANLQFLSLQSIIDWQN